MHAPLVPVRTGPGRTARTRRTPVAGRHLVTLVVLALLVAVAVAPAVSGAAQVPGRGQPRHQDGFVRVMGYTPGSLTLADGTVRTIKPTGTCSTLWAGQPFDFTPACQAHDYGYDLLRHAARRGAPLPPTARRHIDALFARDLHAHCDATRSGPGAMACHALARLSTSAVGLNAWRQGYGPPMSEPVGAWLAAGGALVAAAVIVTASRRRSARRRDRQGRTVESNSGPSSTTLPPAPATPTCTSPVQVPPARPVAVNAMWYTRPLPPPTRSART